MAKVKARGSGMVRYAVFLRPDQIAELKASQQRIGVPASEQIRRALDAALGTSRLQATLDRVARRARRRA